MSFQGNQYQGSRSVVPVMAPQQQQHSSMIVPQQADMYYMNSFPSNQMTTSYTAQQQMSNGSDLVAYNRYVNRPPQDVQYTLNQSGGMSTNTGDIPMDGWNGMWRQSSVAYREVTGQQQQQPAMIHQQPAMYHHQQQMTYAAAPVASGLMGRMLGGGGGGYNAW